jgi:egghead protein (zeste-white 4 protein)
VIETAVPESLVLSASQSGALRRWRTWWLYYALFWGLILLGVLYGVLSATRFAAATPSSWLQGLLPVLKLTWLFPVPYVIINAYAFLRYPIFALPQVAPGVPPLGVRLYFRFVTRGRNEALSRETAEDARRVLEAVLPLDCWRIEVVSDNFMAIASEDGQVSLIQVPDGYRPPGGARFKARALHYALSESPATDDDWIIHLDEETRFDQTTARAIAHFVAGEAHRPLAQRRLGQGVVMYGRQRIVNWLTTLADSLRVGDDYGRFRLQYERGVAYFGMHGSFVVVNNEVERAVGFDHGFAGSITEDTYFALSLQAQGYRFAFLPGSMYEESPFTVADFVRQRRRWYGGLWLCARAPELSFKVRAVLIGFMLTWTVSWLSLVTSFLNLMVPTPTSLWLGVLGGMALAAYLGLYLVGFLVTFTGHLGRGELVKRLLLQVVLLPVFSLMEACGVIYGLVAPPRDFYVVRKAAQSAAQPAAEESVAGT